MEDLTPNSYVSLTTFPVHTTDITVNIIWLSVDRIVLTRVYVDLTILRRHLKLNCIQAKRFDKKPQYRKGKINYTYRTKSYIFPNGQSIMIIYNTDHFKYNRQMVTVVIDNPDTALIDFLSNTFNELNVTYNLCKIEFAWDFYTPHAFRLKEWMAQHLWLYRNRKSAFTYKNTSYLGNPRKSVKAVRMYPRPKDSHPKEYLRVELEIHRPFLLRSDIYFPFTAKQLSLEFSKIIRFCEIDWEKVIRAYVKFHKADRDKINFNATHPIRRHPTRLLRAHLTSDITDIRRLDNLVVQMKAIKKLGLSNPSRFLKPMKGWDWIFNELPREQGFNL